MPKSGCRDFMGPVPLSLWIRVLPAYSAIIPPAIGLAKKSLGRAGGFFLHSTDESSTGLGCGIAALARDLI
jgi:hypothetical protein